MTHQIVEAASAAYTVARHDPAFPGPAMAAAVRAALQESKSPSMALGTEFRSFGVSLDKWRRCIDALIREIEG